MRRIHHFRGGRIAYAALVAAGLAGVAWTISQSTLNAGIEGRTNSVPLGGTLREAVEIIPLWFLQGIGAFPYRDQLAPLSVYVLFVILGLLGVEGAVRHAQPGQLRPLILFMAGWFAVPVVITAATWEKYGHTWQGRYGLPWGLGLAVMVGLVWGQKFRTWWPPLAATAGTLWIVAQVPGVVQVLTDESSSSPLVQTGDWNPPSVAVIVLLVATGATLAWIGALGLGKSLVVDEPIDELERDEASVLNIASIPH